MNPSVLRALAEDWPAPFVYRTVPVTQPAVATGFSVVTPGEGTWGLVALTAKLTTDGNAANRSAVLNVSDGTTTLWSIEPGAVQTATLGVTYSWVPGYAAFPTSIVGNALVVPMGPTYLAPGMTLSVVTANLQVGDQWSLISATVIECLTGHVERERAIEDAIRDRYEAVAELLSGGN